MTSAICFKCGNDKTGAFTACSQCSSTPTTDSELALSLVLCEHLATKSQLAHFSHELRNGFRLTAPESLLNQAKEALKDSQLMSMLGSTRRSNSSPTKASGNPQPVTNRQRTSTTSSPKRERSLNTTELHKNAFHLLGVNTRDDRKKIVLLAEEKSLELDHEACQKARSDLTNPRTRLSVEIAWMPGVSPKRASQLIEQLLRDPMSMRTEQGLPTLAHINLLAAAFESVDSRDDPEDISNFIQEMAYLVDSLSVDEVIRDVNEDRGVSGFPEVGAQDLFENEIAERKRVYKKIITAAINRMPPASLIQVMTLAVDAVTYGGEMHAPELVDELVDSYAIESQNFLSKESENIQKLIKATRDSAKSGERAVSPLVDKLEVVVRNWQKVARPIQLSSKARGIEHELSTQTAYAIRSLAIDLFNEHNLLAPSQRITKLLQEQFTQLPEVAERVEKDANDLRDIAVDRGKSAAKQKEWEREISYRAEVGMVFKDVLSISPDGVCWKDKRYALDSITNVRWGGVSHSVNGVPTGTTYTIAFGDSRSTAVVELRKKEIYSAFIDKLWRAVCVRLLTELFEVVQSGKEVKVGEALIRDDGIVLIKRNIFSSNEQIRCPWSQIHYWSSGGDLYIGSKTDKKTYVSLSYIQTPNAHILEHAMGMAFKKAGMKKLSDVLN